MYANLNGHCTLLWSLFFLDCSEAASAGADSPDQNAAAVSSDKYINHDRMLC